MSENLFGELDVAFRAPGANVVGDDGLAIAGGFGETNAAWNHRLEDLVGKEFPEIGGNLAGQVHAFIKHGKKNAFDAKRRLEGIANAVHGVQKLRDTLQGEELALDRNENAVGSYQSVERQEVQGGWAINDNKAVLLADCLQLIA